MLRLGSSHFLFLLSLSVLTIETLSFHLNQQSQTEPKNLMKEYMTRGMLQCTANYVETIAELQKLIKKAYIEHMKCQEEMETADKSYPQFQKIDFSILDELQSSWKEEDSTAEPVLSQTTETPLSRRKRTHRQT
ncbi:hypothetical protein PFISCL1PPCAC_1712, partial [Pristionchus fissidentatus]